MSAHSHAASRVRPLDAEALAAWPLPEHGHDADKDARGHVLVVAGSDEVPGAALLAAVAALRAGAGKLTMASPRGVALGLALAIPEARVIPLDRSATGGLQVRAAARLAPLSDTVDAVVAGPGMLDEQHSMAFVRALMPLFASSTMVLDAVAMSIAKEGAFSQPVILTPHAGEMANLTGLTKEQVNADPYRTAVDAARQWNAYVVLKGAATYIATPTGETWCFTGGSAGLGTSGSGDTLAGLIGGLAARGTPALAACAWGVVLHARAGDALSRQHGPLGYLARELAGELPALLRSASLPPQRASTTRQAR